MQKADKIKSQREKLLVRCRNVVTTGCLLKGCNFEREKEGGKHVGKGYGRDIERESKKLSIFAYTFYR